MIPDIYDVSGIVLALEKQLHRRGWDDDPPTLWMMIASDDRSGIAIMASPLQPHELDDEATTGLLRMAHALKRGTLDGELRVMPQRQADAMCAVAFTYEGWSSRVPTEERDGRRLADIPGSVETRGVVAVDAGGRLYFCERVRGRQPLLRVDGSVEAEIRGPMALALTEILQGFMKFAPQDSVDHGALEKLRQKLVIE